jgi:outer membrane protein assembly factor BamB
MRATNVRGAAPLILASAFLAAPAAARGEDWPMRGRDASRNPVSPEKRAPQHWQVEARDHGFLVRPSWNVKWEAALGEANFASPVVAGGLVWVGTNNARPRDPRAAKDASVLMCFRESDGQFLWQYVSPRLGGRWEDWPGAGLNCSPLAEGNRLWFTTNRGEVLCLDVGPLRQGTGTPRTVWRLDMRRELGVSLEGPAMGIGCSCSVGAPYRGRIYVSTGNGTDEGGLTVPAPEAPSLLCLDRDTGKVLWSDRSPGRGPIVAPWSSPLVVEVRGRGQVIAAQGDGWVRAFDALSGRLLWKFNANPVGTGRARNGKGARAGLPATPVFHEGRVYVATGRHPAYGLGPGTALLHRPDEGGGRQPRSG